MSGQSRLVGNYLATTLLLVSACGPEVYELMPLDEECTTKCELALACREEASPESMQKCIDGCIEDGKESLAVGADCARAYQRLMTCIESLSCEGWHEWAYMVEPRPCTAETNTFAESCPGVWFAPEEP